MPANLLAAAPVGVLPKMLFTSFLESAAFPGLAVTYHDGTSERSLITDGVNPSASLRSWKLTVRLIPAAVGALRMFWEAHQGGVVPFYWYSPFEPSMGQPVGSNYDGSGVSTQGRYVVRFRGDWSVTSGIALSDVSLELQEVL